MARAGVDLRTNSGTRCSVMLYIDPIVSTRKAVLNGLRRGGHADPITQTAGTFGSVSVSTPSNAPVSAEIAGIERAIGMNLSNARQALLGRGGAPCGLMLTASRLAGVEVITDSELREIFYQAYLDMKKFLTGEYTHCDDGERELPPLTICEELPDPWAEEDSEEAA